MKILLSIPFLLIILIIYNATLLTDPGSFDLEAVPALSMKLPSGGYWYASKGDFIVIGGIILLFLDILKSARFGRGTNMAHGLTLLIMIAFLVEFIVWPAAANSACMILMLICLLDVIGGFVISSSNSRTEFNLGGIH